MSGVRVIVVGGGVIGLLTAMECSRAGAQVSLVDQADIPAPLATSNDRLRVVRALHRGDAALTSAAAPAHQAWLDIEGRLGAHCYHRVGALTAMPAADLPASLALLAGAGAAARELPEAELAGRYPQIRFPAGLAAVFEPAAGAVLASRMLTALARWLRGRPGVRLHPRRQVVGVGDAAAAGVGDTAAVRLADGAILAGDRVVVAAGPWSRALLPAVLSADLTLYRQSVLSYAPAPSRRAWAGMPAIPALGTAAGAWLMPPVADAPVRLSAASACRAVPQMTGRRTPEYWRDHLIGQFSALLTGFDPAAVIGASDGYYLADSSGAGPLLATLGNGAVLAYAACGGMSFKLAPVIARALAARAIGRPPRRTGLDSVDQPRHLAGAGRGEPAGPPLSARG